VEPGHHRRSRGPTPAALREFQWNSYPLNLNGPTTNWSHGLWEDTWWHVALVNDGKHTVMYVDGAPAVDNPP
jgi:hypothetical protein